MSTKASSVHLTHATYSVPKPGAKRVTAICGVRVVPARAQIIGKYPIKTIDCLGCDAILLEMLRELAERSRARLKNL